MKVTKKKTGCPSSYDPKYIGMLLEHFNVELFRIVNGKRVVNPMPTFEGFAKSIGVAHKTIVKWGKDFELFGKAYESCKDKQKDMIIQGGMLGAYNAQFTIFVAKNCTDMKDRVETVSARELNDDELLAEAKEIVARLSNDKA
jgi:hypothetical protein